MTALATAIQKRIQQATEEMDTATRKGAFAEADFSRDLIIELRRLLDRTASTVEVIELDKDDAARIADFLEVKEGLFIELLIERRVSLPGRHSLNLINQLRGR